MISVNRIIYNKFSSQDFDLKTCLSFGGDSGESDTFLNREGVFSETYQGRFRRVHNYKYTDVLAPVITFIKNDFSDLTLDEHRKIMKWLTSKDTASFLTVYHDDSEVISYEVLGAFTEIQSFKMGNGRIVGVQATFESVSPFAYSPLLTVTKDISDPTDNTITINLETDDPQSAVYPRITIQQDSVTNVIEIDHAMTDADDWIEGSVFHYGNNYYWVDTEGVKRTSTTNTSNLETTSVSIQNIHTDYGQETRVFESLVKNNIKGEIITLDGANQVVASSRPAGRIFGDNFDFNWIPLYEGINTLSFIGNCSVTIEWREPIKCGDF